MLSALRKNLPRVANPLIEEMDQTIAELNAAANIQSQTLSTIISDGPSELLTSTENAQPAILATSVIILRALEAHGFNTKENVDFYLGHSLGEFSALVASGTMGFGDALRLVRKRGEIMHACAKSFEDGQDGEVGMVALIVPKNRMDDLLKSLQKLLAGDPDEVFGSEERIVQLANINSSTQVVLSGHINGINHLLHHLRQWSGQDPRAIRLNVSAPFHSMIMQPSVRVITEMLSKYELWFPKHGEVLSNYTARPYKSIAEIKDLLPKQAVQTVDWKGSIQYLDAERNVKKWIGIGPTTKVGRNLIGKEVSSGMKSVFTVGEDLDERGFADMVRELQADRS